MGINKCIQANGPKTHFEKPNGQFLCGNYPGFHTDTLKAGDADYLDCVDCKTCRKIMKKDGIYE